MTLEQARGMLLSLVNNGRISMNGNPLNGMEIGSLQQAVLFLYDRAKEKQENKIANEMKPDCEEMEGNEQ